MIRQRFKDPSTCDFGEQSFYAPPKSRQTLGKAKKMFCPAERGGGTDGPA